MGGSGRPASEVGVLVSPVEQFLADSLDLSPYLNRRPVVSDAVDAERRTVLAARAVPARPVDHVIGDAQHLALAQPEDEDQDVGGIERVVVQARRFEELPGVVAFPGFSPVHSNGWQLEVFRHVAGDQVFGFCLTEHRA